MGCFSNTTFAWAHKYRITKKNDDKNQRLPMHKSGPTDDLTTLPRPPYTDSCKVNAKRLLGLYKYEEQTNGRINGSMFRVAWRFSQTRIIVANLMRAISILWGLIGITVFLKIILNSIHRGTELTMKPPILVSSY